MSIENDLLGNNSSVLIVVKLVIISLAFIWMAQAFHIVSINTWGKTPEGRSSLYPLYTTYVLTVTVLKLMLSILITFICTSFKLHKMALVMLYGCAQGAMKLSEIHNTISLWEALTALYSYVSGTTLHVGVCLNAHQCVSVTPFQGDKCRTGEDLQIGFPAAMHIALSWEWGKNVT